MDKVIALIVIAALVLAVLFGLGYWAKGEYRVDVPGTASAVALQKLDEAGAKRVNPLASSDLIAAAIKDESFRIKTREQVADILAAEQNQAKNEALDGLVVEYLKRKPQLLKKAQAVPGAATKEGNK